MAPSQATNCPCPRTSSVSFVQCSDHGCGHGALNVMLSKWIAALSGLGRGRGRGRAPSTCSFGGACFCGVSLAFDCVTWIGPFCVCGFLSPLLQIQSTTVQMLQSQSFNRRLRAHSAYYVNLRGKLSAYDLIENCACNVYVKHVQLNCSSQNGMQRAAIV